MSLLSMLTRRHPEPEEQPVTRLVEGLLADAAEAGASDLHLGPREDGSGVVKQRIDGQFVELPALAREQLPRVLGRLKVLAGLPAFRTAEPQDGRIPWKHGGVERDLRLATIPVVGGEKAVVRFFDREGLPRDLSELGFSAAVQAALDALLARPAGVLVVTGPCSSGKTTTLYALARRVLASSAGCLNLVTAEDPVEQRLAGAWQTEVDAARGLSFARVLAALLRQDPQVILVGETRDPETARMVAEAGFTGHRVLTSLHASSAEEVPRRLSLLGVPDFALCEGFTGVVSQRLVRRACKACAASGCAACGGRGYAGRLALAEVASLEQGKASLLTPSMGRAGLELFAEGLTTLAEIQRVMGNPPQTQKMQ